MDDNKTYFAPAEQLTKDDIYLQTIKILGYRKIIQVLNILPNLIAIINTQRQVIFTNPAFQASIIQSSFEESLGLRHGELLACINTQDAINGCGTGKECKYCGLALTILESQETGIKQESKATITIKNSDKYKAVDYEVIVSPITLENEVFYLVILNQH